MKKFTLVIHDLREHSPRNRAQLVNYLSSEFCISPELAGMTLRTFPATLKNLVHEIDADEVTTDLVKLGAVVELLDSEGKPRPLTSTREGRAEKPANPSLTPKELSLPFDEDEPEEKTPTSSSAALPPTPPEEEIIRETKLESLELSFEDDPPNISTPEHVMTEPSPLSETRSTEPIEKDFPLSFDEPIRKEVAPPDEEKANTTAVTEIEKSDTAKQILQASQASQAPQAPQASQIPENFEALTQQLESIPEEQQDQQAELEVARAPDTTPLEKEKKNTTEVDKKPQAPKLKKIPALNLSKNQPLIITAGVVGVTIIIVGVFLFSGSPEGKTRTPPPKFSAEKIAEALKAQKESMTTSVTELKGPKKKVTHWAGEKEEGFKTLIGETLETAQLTSKLSLVLAGNEVTHLEFEAKSSKLRKLVPTELVSGVKEPAYLDRFVAKLNADEISNQRTENPLHFSASGRGKAYLRDRRGGARTTTPLKIEGEIDPGSKTISGSWELRTAIDESNKPKFLFAERTSSDKFRFFFRGTLSLTEQEPPAPKEITEKTSGKQNSTDKKADKN